MDKPRRDWGLVIWIALALAAAIIVTAIVSAWAARHALANGRHFSSAQRDFVLAVSEFPGMVRDAANEVSGFFGRPTSLMLDRTKVEKPWWVRRFPAPEDPGYLLLSGLDPSTRRSGVKLIRVSDGKVIARWLPDWNAVYRRITDKKFKEKGSVLNAFTFHPLLLPDGDIVFNTSIAMVRMAPCSPQPVWVLDDLIHHSNELDDEGTIWTGGISSQGFPENDLLRDRIRDDAILRVSQDGRVLERHSLAKILRANGLEPLLLGTNGEALQVDPIHLNQVRMAPRDTPYWKRGDLLLSLRHLSLVMIYRPSTQKVVWQQLGPWMNQHDADFVDDHRISVFDNNVYSGAPEEQPFIAKDDINRVFVYDFATGKATQPFAELLAKARPTTMFEGRARILPDGGLFLEETNHGRILRFTHDRLLWSFVNDYDAKRIGVLAWSRYLTPEEAAPTLEALARRQCAAASS